MNRAPTIRLPSLRFVLLVAAVFVLQVGFIFWLSDRRVHSSAKHRPEARMVLLTDDLLTHEAQELLRLRDESLFALPHVESFSGAAWLSNTPLAYKSFDWTESPRWLPIEFPPLHDSLSPFVSATPAPPGLTTRRPEPELAVPGMLNTALIPQASKLRVLAGVEELGSLPDASLPSWPNSELVSNSVVQVVFTADGRALSAALLAGSGHKPADDYAVAYGRSLAIPQGSQSGSNSIAGPLRWAILSFDWHTDPAHPTATK